LNVNLEPFHNSKVKPNTILLSSLAIQQWCASQKTDINNHPAILVTADTSQYEVVTSIDGNLHKSRALVRENLSLNDFCQQLIHEIIHQYENIPDSLQSKTLLLMSCPETIYEKLNDDFFLSMKRFDRTNLFHLDLPDIETWSSPGEPDSKKENIGVLSIVTSGLMKIILNSTYPHFNLLPQEQLKQQHRKALIQNYLVTGAASIAILLFLWLCLAGMNWRSQRLCHKIEAEIAPIKNIAQTIESKRRQIKAIQDQLANHGVISKIIQEFYEFTPSQIALNELNYTVQPNGNSIQVKGQADVLSNAFGYTEALKKASVLNALQIEDAQQIVKPGGSVVEFRAKCNFKNR
ncbi:MAG TPA: hypothetical protein VHO90_05165, partial [Bacteroidales bacterium]|nr:hypothetical protein [Bacteroidales bacterium]